MAAEDINRTEQALTIVEIPLENPAYIIHTSGTTGDPKGVVISHKAAVNTIEDINSRFDINSADRMFGLANLAFDLSVYDILVHLMREQRWYFLILKSKKIHITGLKLLKRMKLLYGTRFRLKCRC